MNQIISLTRISHCACLHREAEIDLYAHLYFVSPFYYLCLVFAMEPSALAHWILRSHGMESGGGDLKALGSKRPQFTNEAVKLALQGNGNVSGFIREYVICGKRHRMSVKEDIAFPVLFAFGPLWRC